MSKFENMIIKVSVDVSGYKSYTTLSILGLTEEVKKNNVTGKSIRKYTNRMLRSIREKLDEEITEFSDKEEAEELAKREEEAKKRGDEVPF